MSYTKTTWHTGDVVTSAKLNNAETGIENAQWKTEGLTQLFSESVTTIGPINMIPLAYSNPITADTLIVNFNGTEYTCPKYIDDGASCYGAVYDDVSGTRDFSSYPFTIISEESHNLIFTETADTYTVSASAHAVTTTETFNNAVANCCSLIITAIDGTLDKTWQEIHDAVSSGKYCVVNTDNDYSIVSSAYQTGGGYAISADATYTADSADGYPTNSDG